jgi:hypothetical protein
MRDHHLLAFSMDFENVLCALILEIPRLAHRNYAGIITYSQTSCNAIYPAPACAKPHATTTPPTFLIATQPEITPEKFRRNTVLALWRSVALRPHHHHTISN